MDPASIERGRQLLQEMSGGRAEEIEARWRELHPDLGELISGIVAGEFWSRSGLALNRRNALELNIRLALGNGASKAEIAETILHMAVYAGFPAAWEGLEAAERVFAALDLPEGGATP